LRIGGILPSVILVAIESSWLAEALHVTGLRAIIAAMFHSSQYEVRLPVYEGPLELLLHLIEREELDITVISLAQVTGQYLDYLSQLEEPRGSDLASFLVVAAKLLLIKSQSLLPRPPEPATGQEEVGDDLVRLLQAYRQFKEMASFLHEREELGMRSFVRIAARYRTEPHLDLSGVTLDDLVAAAREALHALPAEPVGGVVAPNIVTIEEQIGRIETHLTLHRRAQFREILSTAASRVEIIVSLLALLELVKRDRVRMYQEQLFEPIIVELQTGGELERGAALATQPAP
jgi:segregation and condensation protein A